MSKPTTAKEMFEDHLNSLRKLAIEQDVHLAYGLQSIIKNEVAREPLKPWLGLRGTTANGQTEALDEKVAEFIGIYRLEFYESCIDAKLQNDAVIFVPGRGWLAAPEEMLKKWNAAVKKTKLQEKNLKAGREIGAKVQKDKAAEAEREMLKINADLLKHPDTARWSLKERASYIEKKLKAQNIKQPNGTPYAFSTIKLKITGT
ncbi:MAG: hypothetical protein PHU06_08260 [Gallionella sp.]|nr:hypothetical protein [Gallionella sp.]MDD4958960.1 hypothetical protein [Gallionella sp.]